MGATQRPATCGGYTLLLSTITAPLLHAQLPLQVFISLITATSNDVCKEKKRATITADDVFQALEDLEFGELLPALKDSFEGEGGKSFTSSSSSSRFYRLRHYPLIHNTLWSCVHHRSL